MKGRIETGDKHSLPIFKEAHKEVNILRSECDSLAGCASCECTGRSRGSIPLLPAGRKRSGGRSCSCGIENRLLVARQTIRRRRTFIGLHLIRAEPYLVLVAIASPTIESVEMVSIRWWYHREWSIRMMRGLEKPINRDTVNEIHRLTLTAILSHISRKLGIDERA